MAIGTGPGSSALESGRSIDLLIYFDIAGGEDRLSFGKGCVYNPGDDTRYLVGELILNLQLIYRNSSNGKIIIEYEGNKPGDFGNIICEVTEDGKEMSGKFVGHSGLTESIVNGYFTLHRVGLTSAGDPACWSRQMNVA